MLAFGHTFLTCLVHCTNVYAMYKIQFDACAGSNLVNWYLDNGCDLTSYLGPMWQMHCDAEQSPAYYYSS